MTHILINNVNIVNEGKIITSDVLIGKGRISHIAPTIVPPSGTRVVDGNGKYLLPGMIDDQVHFREPGFTGKGSIETESRAAIAGGVTSFMDMPNVNPQTTTINALEAKYKRAEDVSYANYAFYFGATNDNLDELKKLNPNQACGVKVFMGSSTGNMLVDKKEAIEGIFKESPVLVATHCEDSPMIEANEAEYRVKYGDNVPMKAHAAIRSAQACYTSSSMAVALAKKHNTRLHVLHLTTKDELELFEPAPTLELLADKRITTEVCVHHLFFNDEDYERLGSQIKCNPSVKGREHQEALLSALNQGVIDIIATDHAPHTWQEKQGSYFNVPSGVPLVQHALLTSLEFYHQGLMSLEAVVQKVAHAPATVFQLQERGFIREGYWADLVLVDLNKTHQVNKENILYQCGWSPFDGYEFKSSVEMTLVNGHIAYEKGNIAHERYAQRLTFER